MSQLNEVVGQLQAANERLLKARGEIIDRINALEEALGDVDLPDEAGEALTALMATCNRLMISTPTRNPRLVTCRNPSLRSRRAGNSKSGNCQNGRSRPLS